MAIDWQIVGEIAKPVAGGVVTLLGKTWFERKPKLLSWFGSVSTHNVAPPGQQAFRVFTHEVVLRNVGKKPAKDVRMAHHVLPDFCVFPPVQYIQEANPSGANDLVFPVLLPGEQVTVSYLYFPPLKVDAVHAGIKHADGFAQAVNVQIQRQVPKALMDFLWTTLIIGLVTCLYLLWHAGVWPYERF